MGDDVLQTYLAGVDPEAAPLVTELDRLVRAAHPGFDVAIKYGILTYALDGDWRTWVCAVQANRNGVCLRFLYGVLLTDPLRVLRSGSSVLKTWDVPFGQPVDVDGMSAYVTEAVARYPEYRANWQQVLAESRAAARPRRPPA